MNDESNIPNIPGLTVSSKISPSRFRKRLLRSLLLTVLGGILILAGYSIHVANYEPDPQETVILGQTQMAAGSGLGIRVLVRNRVSGRPVAHASVNLSLTGKGSPRTVLGTYFTDASGSLADPINVPDLPPGDYQLTVDVASPLGRDHVVRKVAVQSPLQLLLTTDKPLYQPGQTIHLRSLSLNRRTQKPSTNQTVTFEVTDAKGNKVFKETHPSSAFGISSADFELATELNAGRYLIQAQAGGSAAERTVEVTNYVLPKFRVTVAADKSYYKPGDVVAGSVQADYFFGKPVSGGIVTLTASTFDAMSNVMAELSGTTDAAGRWTFKFALPGSMTGLPQTGGQGMVDLSAEVGDAAGHRERKLVSLPVAADDLQITAVPEAGALVPGVENLVYILTAYPDGRPADCQVTVNGASIRTGAQGLGTVRLTPVAANQLLGIQARDAAGHVATIIWRAHDDQAPPLLLRTEKAVYAAGETAAITLLSAEADNTVFIDVIKDGQTVLTKSVPLANHQARYNLNLPASLTGALKINAYVIPDTGEDRGCSRLIYVNPGSGLRIAARASKPVYRPGETAKFDFTVTDAAGNPAPGALGISVVDESVFALSEDRPGLLSEFLAAEAELLKPRYEIKSFGDPETLLLGAEHDPALAQAWLASCGQMSADPQGLEALIKSGELPRTVVDHALSLRGTRDYETLRNDPQFAPLIRQLESQPGAYNLREITGPEKAGAVETWRKAYFDKLGHLLGFGFLAGVFLLPFIMIIRSARRSFGVDASLLTDSKAARYVALVGTLYRMMAALVMFPFLFYPLGGLIADHGLGEDYGWGLLAIETAVVLAIVAYQFRRLSKAGTEITKTERNSLRPFLILFLVQFACSRGTIVFLAQNPGLGVGFYLWPWWLIASLIVPFTVLAGLTLQIERQMDERGIAGRVRGDSILGIMAAMACMIVLAAMLQPALAAAKRKAQMINLMNDLKQIDIASRMAAEDGTSPAAGGSPAPRLRQDFPETLFWQPELITDDAGRASLEIPMADSITTWRASVDAVNADGKIGSLEMPVPVFQDFFVDLDLPASLTLNDEISIPVSCYNYLKEPQDIHLRLKGADWFECAVPEVAVRLEPGAVKGASFPIKVRRAGRHALRVDAQGARLADAVEREIEVRPAGTRVEDTRNETLRETYASDVMISPAAIPDSASLWAKFYPSHFSEIVEGLESIFRAPYGCFEQTSSVTYPNVLVLDYLNRTGQLTPEVEVPARKFINAGYQRLLTFEVPGGGFEWFGRDPANICLTAYGILEFTDMARVHPVDEQVTGRARQWLFSKQNADGSWEELNRGWTWADRGPITAFAAWALGESGDHSANFGEALNYLRAHPAELSTLYAKALAAIALLDGNRNDAFGRQLASEIKAAAIIDSDDMAHWAAGGYSVTYSHDSGMEVECTALCVMALARSGQAPSMVKHGLTWISRHKFADGTLGSTQATILAMRALLEGTGGAIGQDFDSTITVSVNGEKADTFQVNQKNSDVMKQIDLTPFLKSGVNRVELRQSPAGELPFQVAGAYWLPETAPTAVPSNPEALAIDVRFDRATLAVNDLLKSMVTVKNNAGSVVNMAIVDLGIPPGFELDASAFDALVADGKIEKFEATGNQVILYLRQLRPGTPFQFSYLLRAKYPLRIQTPPSTVYEYYQPQNRAASRPAGLQVVGQRRY